MGSYEEFEKFIGMEPSERDEAISDLLAGVAEPWLGTNEERLVLGFIASMRAILDTANAYADARENGAPEANGYVLGMFAHAYNQHMHNFATMAALSDVKRKHRKD